MFEIGSSLREARLRRGLELAAVESATKIRARYLAALEEERFDLLPGPAYGKGFLRSYAEYLGFDAQPFVDEYNFRFPEDEAPLLASPTRELTWPWRLERAGTVLAAAAAIALLGILAWKFGSSSRQPILTQVPLPRPARTAARPPLAPPRPARKVAPAPAPPRLVLTAARGNCWLSVRVGSRAGRVLYEGLLHEGDSLRFARKRLWIRIGAPWNLDARLSGQPVKGLPANTGNVVVTSKGLRPA